MEFAAFVPCGCVTYHVGDDAREEEGLLVLVRGFL
jgi:hypothetical protein